MVDIITAEVKDASAIIDLQRLAYQAEAKIYNDWTLPPLTQTVESLQQEFESAIILKTTIILKATINNRIVGSVRANLEGGVCKIGRLIVHPEFQLQGIGSRLLAHIESTSTDANSFELFTGNKSLGNIRLYEKHGYVISHIKALSETLTIVFLAKPNQKNNKNYNNSSSL
jgi:GNAT superfamily N-acetyltransferase